MHRAAYLFLLLCLTVPTFAEEETPSSPPPTVEDAAAAVLAAVTDEDADALAALAAKDEPDPWLVTDALCADGQHDAAEALAAAAPRADIEALADYVAALRAEPLADLRARVAAVKTALRARQPETVLAQTETLAAAAASVPRIRLQHARAMALVRMGRVAEAEAAFRAGAEAARTLGWLRRAALLFQHAGMTAANGFAWELALTAWEARLAVEERRGNPAGAGRTLNNLGLVQRNRGELEQAAERFDAALKTAQEIDDADLAATVLGNMGIIHELRGDLAQALATYEQALRQKRAIGDAHGATITLSNIGAVQDAQGAYAKALATSRRALEECEALGDPGRVAAALGDLGSAHHALGNHAEALSTYETAIAQLEALGDADGATRVLGNLAGLYYDLGDYKKAQAMGERTLALREAMGDRVGAADARGNAALFHAAQGDHERALALYAEALENLEALGMTGSAVHVMGNIGISQHRLGRHDEALATLRGALEQSRAMKNRGIVASLLQAIGQVHWAAGEATEALDALEESARLARRLRARSLQVSALRGLAEIRLAQGDSARALSAAQTALTAMEGLLGGLGEEQGAAAREMHARLFAIGTLAALQEDDIAEALTFLESGRAGALLDAMGKREELRWKAESLSPELQQADAAARVAEKTARRHYDKAVGTGNLAAIRAAGQELDAASDAVRAVAGRIQRALKQQAQLFYPRAETIEAVQDALEEGEVLVLYGLCLDEALALVLRRDGERVVALGSVAELAAACEALDASRRTEDVTAPLAALRTLLVAPLELEETVERVLVSPEGPLCYVPFGALFEQRAVSLTPSGTTHVLLREGQREPGTGILALGDPHYGAVSEGAQAIYYRGRQLTELPASRTEVETIGTTTLLGEAASEAGLREALGTADSWRALHLACHGLVNVKRPMLSSLALSRSGEDDGFVTALEILRMQIPADLAVLSACDTARGRIVRGEGIVGLTRAFMFAGAPRVICSLWKVDDAATQALMIKFYELWNPDAGAEGIPAATALQQAQAFVKSHDKWKHPYYWAAWVLWGLPD